MGQHLLKLTSLLMGAVLVSGTGFARGTVSATVSGNFGGVVPQPRGTVSEAVTQLKIQFPASIDTSTIIGNDPFKVVCNPAAKGFGGWADNDTLWTYTIKVDKEYSANQLVGGSKCTVTQVLDLKSTAGKVWAKNTINYNLAVAGPTVKDIYVAHGFNDSLREKEPLILVLFDGPVNGASIFGKKSSYLSYKSANAPAEKILLSAVPKEQIETIFSEFKTQRYFDVNFQDKNWVLATVQKPLIPGAAISLVIQNQVSAVNPDVSAKEIYTKDFTVRSQFQAEVQCQNPSANEGVCLPQTPITVKLNGRVKFTDLRKAYIEYIPYKSTDQKRERTYATEMPEGQEIGLWDSVLNYLSGYFPYLAKFSDTVVDVAEFKVQIEPETIAKIVLPRGLKDIENRVLPATMTSFDIRIGAMVEWINTPQKFSIYESKTPNLSLPVGLVNLNQDIIIRRSGTETNQWAPINDIPSIIHLIRSYALQGEYRNEETYVSPMEQFKVQNTVFNEKLSGQKNRPYLYQIPFAKSDASADSSGQAKNGIYALEISSASLEQTENSSQSGIFVNPRPIIAQVTDLAIHLKKGSTQSMVWVTQLSSAQSIAGAQVSIYNCMGDKVRTYQTNAQGLVSFPNEAWATDCKRQENEYLSYSEPTEFYVVAENGSDLALTHSSWNSPNDSALFAPGIEWFDSSLTENKPHFHNIIGVNLVKPGQEVPVQIVSQLPVANGFKPVPADLLPTTARIVSQSEEDLFFEFPLNWENGSAEINWQVPSDSSVKLGSYAIYLVDPKDPQRLISTNGDIEVGEFKVPLMTGIIGLPEADLVKPEVLQANTNIRYANGVGAKALPATLSYYFEPTNFQSKAFADYSFGTGPVTLKFDGAVSKSSLLPGSDRPATIEELKTEQDGSLIVDIAKEQAPQGGTIAKVLKTMDRPQKMVVRVRYQDQMGEFQTISKAKTIFNSNLFLGTKLKPGQANQAHLQTVLIGLKDENQTNLQDLKIEVQKIESKIIGEELFGGLIKNTLERTLKPANWSSASECQLSNQVVSCSVGALKEGNYAFQVTSASGQQTSHLLFKIDTDRRVYGENDYSGFGDSEDGKTLPLTLNKETYKHGETAVVSFSSPFSQCKALVTLERNDIIKSFIVDQACETGKVEIPVESQMAPNAFVSIYAITGRVGSADNKVGEQDLGRPTYRLGYANLKVDWSQFKSSVNVTLNKSEFKPGETVSVTANVKSEMGSLNSGTVTFVAIEEKILELKANETYQMLNDLMQLRAHSVSTVTTLEHIESANKAALAEGARKGGDEGGDGSSKSDFKRKLFNALVAFKANVPVENGVATYSFKVNDSLTKFKVFAIAVDSANKFGTGSVSYLTSQETQTYSNIPVVAYSGDEFPIIVTIQNNGKANAQLRAEVVAIMKDKNGIEIDRKTLSKDKISVPASGSIPVDLGSIEMNDNASRVSYRVNIYDEKGNLVDVIEPEDQVVFASVPVTLKQSFLVSTEGKPEIEKLLKKSAGSLPGKGEVQVSVSKSLVGGALEQIRNLVKQDQFSDMFVESKFNKEFLLSSESNSKSLKLFLETLIGYTDSNGMIKYYPQASAGDIYLTARIINVLSTKKWALKLLPSALKEKMKGAVSKVLKKNIDPATYIGTKPTPMDWLRAQTVMGQSAFALGDKELMTQAREVAQAFSDELNQNENAFGAPLKNWSNSDLLSYATLEVYVNKNAYQTSKSVQILTTSRMLHAGNTAQLAGKPGYVGCYSDETIESASLLFLQSLANAPKDMAKSVALGLVNASTKAWYNSTTMTTVALGLEAFASSYEGETVSGVTRVDLVELNKDQVIDWQNSQDNSTLKVEWPSESVTVKVAHNGGGSPWIGINALSAVPLTQSVNQGLTITKTLRNLNREDGFKTGDVIEVELKIQSAGVIRHVGLQDPIPAGSNILGEAYGSYNSGQKKYSGYWFYLESIRAGSTVLKYQFQLNNPGTFKMAPTRAQGLFTPSVFGETPNSSLTVK